MGGGAGGPARNAASGRAGCAPGRARPRRLPGKLSRRCEEGRPGQEPPRCSWAGPGCLRKAREPSRDPVAAKGAPLLGRGIPFISFSALKVKGWKKIFHANRDQKKAGVAILISDKIDFKTKAVKRDKDGHYIMIKGSIQEEDITIINIYAPNIRAPQYIRQMITSMKGEINSKIIIVGENDCRLMGG